jgi:hypothetical protein
MSWGIVACSKCRREMHQNGPVVDDVATWLHCEDQSPACEGGRFCPEYEDEVRGKFCQIDGMGEQRLKKRREP